jgi:hypothetical protein
VSGIRLEEEHVGLETEATPYYYDSYLTSVTMIEHVRVSLLSEALLCGKEY